MQNWEHLLHLMEHLNLRPTAPHGADFSRVRLWCLQGWGRHFRQSAIFSQVALAPINALLGRHGNNYAGSVSVINPLPTGSISGKFVFSLLCVVLPVGWLRKKGTPFGNKLTATTDIGDCLNIFH